MTGPKLLSKFLKDNNLPQKDAIGALRVSRTVLYYWLTGAVTPGEQSRADVATWTRGAVPAVSWGPIADRRGRKSKAAVKPFVPKPRVEV